MLKNLAYSLITKIGIALINFLILLFSSRYLGVSSRGEISIFILNITAIQIINEVYTGYSIIHFIPKFDFKKILSVGVMYTLIFCSLSNAILVFFNKHVSGYEWIAYAVSLLVIMNTFNCVLILGKENLKIYNYLSFFQPLILLLGLLICVFFRKIYTLEAFVYPLLISFALAFIFSSIVVSKYVISSAINKNFELKPILISGFLYQIGSLMYVLSNRYSYYILPQSADVGLYSSATSLVESALIIVNGISPVLLSRIANRSQQAYNSEMTLTLGKVSFILTCVLVMIILVIPADFFAFILGSGFFGIKGIMMSYAPAVIMASFFIALSNYFIAIGNQRSLVFCYSLGFLSCIFMAPVLIQKFGILGAALNANIAYFLICISLTILFMYLTKLKFSRIFSLREDLNNLKNLIQALH